MAAADRSPTQNITAAKREVDSMIDAARPFGEIEDYIESLALHPEVKTALWLLAWAQQERHVREITLAESLARVAA